MDKLQLLEESIAHALAISPDNAALRAAASIITTYRGGETDGVTAQKLADVLLPAVEQFLPPTGPIGVVLNVLRLGEPFVGELVDWTEMRFAKVIPGVDLQDAAPQKLPT